MNEKTLGIAIGIVAIIVAVTYAYKKIYSLYHPDAEYNTDVKRNIANAQAAIDMAKSIQN